MNYGNSLAVSGAAVAPFSASSPWLLFSAVSLVIAVGAFRTLFRKQSTCP